MRQIKIFDTTLRDGEQSPGASMTVDEKLQAAKQLARLKVDIVEAGFPIASPGDFEAVRAIAVNVKGITVAALSRTKEEDIVRAGEAIKQAESGRIHTFIATSDIHLKYKLRMSRDEVLESAVRAVTRARNFTEDVEFSAEDATRSDRDYLCRVIERVIDAGAKTVNIPDTVGYTVPQEYGELIEHIMNKVPNIDKTIISVHCHNDLGLAVANSLTAILKGAGQVECTINGIGERAGNAAIEEIVMALKTRPAFYNADTNIRTQEIYKTSRLISKITGIVVQPNKAIVGNNAFAHEAGIHQDGFLKERSTYEIMKPEDIGIPESKLVLGKHSGRHAFRERLSELGYDVADDELNKAFGRFKRLADQKKYIFDEDIEALISEEVSRAPEVYSLVSLNVQSGTDREPASAVSIMVDGKLQKVTSNGDGPVDATYKAIKSIINTSSMLVKYEVKGITGGTDALGEVTVTLEEDGYVVRGTGADTDIITASAKAYINALNKLECRKRKIQKGI